MGRAGRGERRRGRLRDLVHAINCGGVRSGAVGAGRQAAESAQINPSKTKPHQIEPSKIAWFYLVLFVRIGTFQWVTANPNKKISVPPLSRCARRAERVDCAKCVPFPVLPRGGCRLIRSMGKLYHDLRFLPSKCLALFACGTRHGADLPPATKPDRRLNGFPFGFPPARVGLHALAHPRLRLIGVCAKAQGAKSR